MDSKTSTLNPIRALRNKLDKRHGSSSNTTREQKLLERQPSGLGEHTVPYPLCTASNMSLYTESLRARLVHANLTVLSCCIFCFALAGIVLKRTDDADCAVDDAVASHLLALKNQRENGWKAESSPVTRRASREEASPPTARPTDDSAACNGDANSLEHDALERLGRPSRSDSITVSRTDDSSMHHIGSTVHHMYEHLTGYLKWTKSAAADHLEANSFEQIDKNLDWSDLHSLKELKCGLTSQVYLANWQNKKIVVKVARPA
eukprot:10530-Heterococcus_DN1.PRE.1